MKLMRNIDVLLENWLGPRRLEMTFTSWYVFCLQVKQLQMNVMKGL